MKIDQLDLRQEELVSLSLRTLYKRHGYELFRMSKFEKYEYYAGNKDFLVSDRVITFYDTNGDLLALKPDVTLSIIKNYFGSGQEKQKLFYHENVYRPDLSSGQFREIQQTGLECIGPLTEEDLSETVMLAAESLQEIHPGYQIHFSHLGLLTDLLDQLTADESVKRTAIRLISRRSLHDLRVLLQESEASEVMQNVLFSLMELSCPIGELPERLNAVSADAFFRNEAGSRAIRELKEIAGRFLNSDLSTHMIFDFSVINDLHYYNGIIFQGIIPGLPDAILAGGEYDRLLQRMGKKGRAVGFAVYLSLMEKLQNAEAADDTEEEFLNIALPKGRLGEKVYELLASAGYSGEKTQENDRRLVFENRKAGVRYFWVKPSDVTIYVERGAADIGIAGKDILLENNPELFELLDLKIGVCRMAVAGPKGFVDDRERVLRVATKYPRIAKDYFAGRSRDIDIIKLNGSIELAPILGLSDVIVDIVETGKTLADNDLQVLKTVCPISARLVANPTSYRFQKTMIQAVTDQLEKLLTDQI